MAAIIQHKTIGADEYSRIHASKRTTKFLKHSGLPILLLDFVGLKNNAALELALVATLEKVSIFLDNEAEYHAYVDCCSGLAWFLGGVCDR